MIFFYLIFIMLLMGMYFAGEEDQRRASKGCYERYIKECYVSKNIIRDILEQNKAKTDCRYCNNACDSYAVCTVLKEILEKGNK